MKRDPSHNQTPGGLRICQVMLAKGFGGAERLFVDLAIELAAAGAKVLPICHPQGQARRLLEAAGIRCTGLRSLGWWDPIAPHRIAGIARRFRADVVHAHLARATCLAARAKSDIPLVTSLHNYGKRRYYRRADHYLPITRDGARHLRDMGVHGERITIMPNFSRVAAVAGPPGSANETPHLLAYGRFVEKKGFSDLVRALAKLRADGRDFRLRLGGDGPLRPLLMSDVESLGLAERVVFAGWLDDVVAELDQADLFVLPSRHEPFGIVALEAMARGVPIVTTRTEGPGEILSEECAYFANINDPPDLAATIARAVSNPQDRYRRAAAALALYRQQYTASAVIPRLLQVYQALAEGRPAAD